MRSLKPSQIIPGVLSVGIYLIIVGLLLFYFNTRSEDNAKKYVKKNDERIQVSFANPEKKKIPKVKKKKETKKSKMKKKPKAKKKKKAEQKPKAVKKKHVKKEKIVKKKKAKKQKVKKRDVNKTKKKHLAKDLFANVKTTKKNVIEVTEAPKKKSAVKRINSAHKQQKNKQRGVESAYLAKVQSLLEGWPAQSEYAGEKVKVLLYIEPSGYFEFKITSASNNSDFNRGLREYLEQLQDFGFGRHKGGRTYNFEAEFIAKE